MKCSICNSELNTQRQLLSHVKYMHNLDAKEYFDLCHNSGICKICGKPTKFVNFSAGYKPYCSAKCAANSDETKQRRTNTNLLKYGCANVSQNTEIKTKKLHTYKSHVEEIKEKVKSTNNQRYGCDWVTQSDEFKKKASQTCIEKYGVSNFAQSNKYKEKFNITKQTNIQYMIDNGYIPLQEINAKFGTGWVQQNHHKVTTYKNKGYVHINYLNEIEQYSTRVNSSFQHEVFNFVNSPNAIQNSRSIIKPYELDIYLPDKKLAIECDGIYWHSKATKEYHLEKTKMCEQLGIRLIHITDWQWHNQTDIIKSIINSALNRYDRKIYARNCVIKEVSNKDAKLFLDINHIQGGLNAKKHIGLYFNNELVQLISLGNSRYKKNEYELYRMCTKLNTQVIGGFAKLLKTVKESIISYVDRSLFTGSGYLATGWTLLSETPPSYAYYKQNIRLSRTQTQKHKLPNIITNYNPNISEKDNMLNNGWSILYDCGTFKFMKGCD